jgi:hypothetical protein
VLTPVGLLGGEVADDGEELLRGLAARRRRRRSHLRRGERSGGRPSGGFWKVREVSFPAFFDMPCDWGMRAEGGMEWALTRLWSGGPN